MRRARGARLAALVLAVVAATAASTSAAPEGDSQSFLGGVWDGDSEPAFAVPAEDRARVVRELDDAVRPFAERLLATPVSLECVALARRGGGAADEFLASETTRVDGRARALLRAELEAGNLVPFGRAQLTGTCGEVVAGDDYTATSAALGSDIECAIGSAITFPWVHPVRTGLSARARVTPWFEGRSLVRFGVGTASSTELSERETVAGTRIDGVHEGFDASGAAVMSVGETIAVRGTHRDGSGTVVLLTLRAAPNVDLAKRLDDGWTAVPDLIVSERGARSIGDVDGVDVGLDLDDGALTYLPDRLVEWQGDFEIRPSLVALAAAATDDARAVGVVFVQHGDDGELGAAVSAVQARTSERTLSVADSAGNRCVVPIVPGARLGGRTGPLRTAYDLIDVETGCDNCIGVAEGVRQEQLGLEFSGIADDDGTLWIDARSHTEVHREMRAHRARRSLPGHASFTFDDVTLPHVADTVRRVRSRVPAGGGELAGGFTLSIAGPAAAGDDRLRCVAVQGGDVWLRPGERARVLSHDRTPHVVRWEREASCGVTFRYPHVVRVPAGHDVSVLLRDETVDVCAVLRAAPNVVDPAFDPRDGVVEIVRQAVVAFAGTGRVGTSTDAGAAGSTAGVVAAQSGGLRLAVNVPSNAVTGTEQSTRRLEVGAGAGTWEVAHVDGTALEMIAGELTWLPEILDEYVSNHLSGEASTDAAQRIAGVWLEIDDAEDGVAQGFVVARGPVSTTAFELKKHQAVDRPDTEVALLLPSQTVRRAAFAVAEGRPLELGGATGTLTITSAAPAADEDTEDER